MNDTLGTMASSIFFYDLETSGLNPREARIMQIAGQRTNLELEPIGEPVNILIKLTPEILPDPDAIMVTGITPQSTIADGVTEAEFLKIFYDEIATPGTIFAGYNTIRFDDEFMRYLNYRNFYDAYEWQWKDDRSRWDLLDVVRTTRALRPDGIEWPFSPDGKPSNRLELLTAVNKLDHANAHDALSDVHATISVAKLIQAKQPKLFEFLLSIRDKKKVAALVEAGDPFVYTSGKYPSEFEKTTIVDMLAKHPKKQGALVYDLRHDPEEFLSLTPKELAARWTFTRDENAPLRLPVKTLQYNRCPAVAPIGVLDAASQKRIKIDLQTVASHNAKLNAHPDFAMHVLEAVVLMDKQQQASFLAHEQNVDGQLYDNFISDADKNTMRAVRVANPDELDSFIQNLKDQRLKTLLPLYKARNFPQRLTPDERESWEKFSAQRLIGGGQQSRLAKFFGRLQELSVQKGITQKQQYLLEELRLYAESIMPAEVDEL
jgi:exodeoxyribonuclease-1